MSEDHGFDMSDFTERPLTKGHHEQPRWTSDLPLMVGGGSALFLVGALALALTLEVERRWLRAALLMFGANAVMASWLLLALAFLVTLCVIINAAD